MSRNTVRGFSGATLRRLREARGISAEDLADAAGIAEATLRSWESGRATPTPALLANTAKVLRLSIADLLLVEHKDLELADLRNLAGINQADAAELLGMSPTSLVRIEKGRREYDAEIGRQLAKIYKVKVRELQTVWNRTRAARIEHLKRL